MTQPNQTAQRNEVPIQCPQCGNAYSSPVVTMIDVGAVPELRSYFLSGQLNVAVCPKCNTPIMLEVPLVYHDPKAEFLAIYFPQQLNIPELEKQKMIGELTQALMRSLPPEQRKGYFFNPRQFVNRQNLTDAVYGTMGISQEELDRQRKKAKLVEQLMVFADDPKGLQMMIKGKDVEFEGEFFAILNGMLEQASATGDEKSQGRLEMLRENLLPVTTWGKRAQKQRAAVESLKDVKDPQELLDKVVSGDDDEVAAIALAARPALDYKFFESLTARVDAARARTQRRRATPGNGSSARRGDAEAAGGEAESGDPWCPRHHPGRSRGGGGTAKPRARCTGPPTRARRAGCLRRQRRYGIHPLRLNTS